MASLRRFCLLAFAVATLAATATLVDPSPTPAQANLTCDLGAAPIDAATGAIGVGAPAGDVCDAVTDPIAGLPGKALDPLKDAATSLGNGVFKQITDWVTEGASWLVGEVTTLIDETTSPDLLSRGFLTQYKQMALIATFMAALMLLFAVLEGIGRGDLGMLARVVLVNVPLAAIATSAAYVVVQLLIATTDGLSHAVAVSTGENTERFFRGAIRGLGQAGAHAGAAGGTAVGGPGVGTAVGAASGATAVPLFVSFIAAVVAAFAAFFVWIELLMRDAAIYVVALFMPLALAASIWPRWSSALRRTAELIVVVIASKFVIVAILSLAASLMANTGGRVEHVLAAGALMLLACFSPLVLFKLVPFAEGAMSAAYARQGAAGGAMRGVGMASSAQMMRATAMTHWGRGGGGSGTGGGPGGGIGGPRGGGGAGLGGGGAAASKAASAGGASSSASVGAGAGAAVAPAAAAAAVPAAAAKGSKAAGERLGDTATAQQASGAGSASQQPPRPTGDRESQQPRPRTEQSDKPSHQETPQPSEAEGGKAPGGDTQPPRPAPEVSTTTRERPAK